MPRLELPEAYMERVRKRRSVALGRAEKVCRYLWSLGASEVYISGSVLTEEFREHSDVDFGVMGLPSEHIYKVESKVEELLGGMLFDLVYMEYAPGYITRRIRDKGKKYVFEIL
jgi:predicted nucleotidyltransferase